VLVEDNPDFRELFALNLEALGADVRACESGTAGLAALDDGPVDVLITDLGLPGMSGYEIARRARERRTGALLVALTGYGTDETRRRVQEAGFDLHLVKPVRAREVAVELRRARAENDGGETEGTWRSAPGGAE